MHVRVAMLDPLPPDIRFEQLLLRPEDGIFVCRKERGSRPSYSHPLAVG
jgi:hypothetical protein